MGLSDEYSLLLPRTLAVAFSRSHPDTIYIDVSVCLYEVVSYYRVQRKLLAFPLSSYSQK